MGRSDRRGARRGERPGAVGRKFLEAIEALTGVGIARGDRTAGAGIATFKIDRAYLEADDVAFVGGEELIFPKRRERFLLGESLGARSISRDVRNRRWTSS